VRTELEDDYHCMAVTLRHQGGVVTAVESEMDRAPWTTCPGAPVQLQATFAGVALAEVARRGEKSANCTHLYDLAQLGAAHAGDAGPTVYDILVSDPVEGRRRLELRRDGQAVMTWVEDDGQLVEPAAAAGATLLKLRDYIDSLPPREREEARLLRWGGIVAHGRLIPLANQSDATRMPPNCFSFQPERAVQAKRVGEIREFSFGAAQPLDRRPPAAPPRREQVS
jgi:hypothetical protein